MTQPAPAMPLRIAISSSLIAMVMACGLFPDLSDVTGDASTVDASSLDAGDAGATDARIDVGDAAWQRVESEFIVSSDGGSVTTAAYSARAGDLVIIGCDMAASVTIADLTAITSLSPNEVGPARFPNSVTAGGVQAMVWWGVVQSSFDGGAFAFRVTPQGSNSFTDCTIDVYRGGTAGAALVDSKISTGVDAGLVSCGPVSTVPGGVAYYIAVRWGCAGVPLQTFTQEQDPEGNPNGDLAPTDGAAAQTQLADCNNSTGDWVCVTLAISP